MSNSLRVIIEGNVGADADLWDRIREFARAQRARSVVVERIGSEQVTPPLAGETFRANAAIYVVNLQQYSVSSSLNRKLKKAKTTSMKIVDAAPEQAVSGHLATRDHSNARRTARGENIDEPGDLREKIEIATKLGRARFFMAVDGAEVLSSVFVILSGKSAYYFTGGTSARGMDVAAAYFCLAGTIEILRGEGYETLNLGIVSRTNEGLAQFKQRLGGQAYPYERVHADYPSSTTFGAVLRALARVRS
jgi:lipid II:glycine glycyltransferase (peptidoglycan interpeptide bridge formation enzyme)